MIKALSVKHPWADMICEGVKSIEVRSWRTSYRGDLVICSSATPADFMKLTKLVHPRYGIWLDARDYSDRYSEAFYHMSSTICIVELYDITEMTYTDEERACIMKMAGMYSWHLRNVRPLKPMPVKGQLNLFNIDPKLIIYDETPSFP